MSVFLLNTSLPTTCGDGGDVVPGRVRLHLRLCREEVNNFRKQDHHRQEK
jgi:hypothetical protein